MLTAWLRLGTRDEAYPNFGLVEIDEHVRPPSDMVKEHVADLLLRGRVSPEVQERLRRRLGERGIALRVAPSSALRGRRGDWGEAVLYGLLEQFEGYELPVKKLRFKLARGQSLPGTDIVAFTLEHGRIQSVMYVEAKVRTSQDLDAAVDAYGQLRADWEHDFADVLTFVDEVVNGRAGVFPAAFQSYLESRERLDQRDCFRIALVLDVSAWDERLLSRLSALPPDLAPLTVCTTQIADLARFIEQTYALVGINDVEDDDE